MVTKAASLKDRVLHAMRESGIIFYALGSKYGMCLAKDDFKVYRESSFLLFSVKLIVSGCCANLIQDQKADLFCFFKLFNFISCK